MERLSRCIVAFAATVGLAGAISACESGDESSAATNPAASDDDAGSPGGSGGGDTSSSVVGGSGGLGAGGLGNAGGGGGDDQPIPLDCGEVGEEQPCYGGAASAAGVGECAMGTQPCVLEGEFLVWGECEGWVAPIDETCGDALDSDCDGDNDNGCLACDGVSPLWTDPFMNGALKLFNMETAGFDVGPHVHSAVCVTDQARINVCEDTVLQLNGAGPAIIAGEGIGATGAFEVLIELTGTQTSEVFILADATLAPISFKSSLSNAKLTIYAVGTHGLHYEGTSGELILGSEGDLTTGVIDANGDVTISATGTIFINGDITAGGNLTIGGALTINIPPCT